MSGADGTGSEAVQVPADEWSQVLADRARQGFDMLQYLTAIDDGTSLRVACRLRSSADARAVLLVTSIPADLARLDSVTGSHPGAAWHERETREMFGIAFLGLADDRPLLLRAVTEKPPLRRDAFLAARTERGWPGAAEPEVAEDGRRPGNPGRRRARPLGVPADPPPGKTSAT